MLFTDSTFLLRFLPLLLALFFIALAVTPQSWRVGARRFSLANAVLLAGSDRQKKRILPKVAGGETIMTLAFTEPSARFDAEGVELTAARTATSTCSTAPNSSSPTPTSPTRWSW